VKKNREKIDSENPGANNSAVENCTGKEWAVESERKGSIGDWTALALIFLKPTLTPLL